MRVVAKIGDLVLLTDERDIFITKNGLAPTIKVSDARVGNDDTCISVLTDNSSFFHPWSPNPENAGFIVMKHNRII